MTIDSKSEMPITQSEMIERAITSGIAKSRLAFLPMFLSAILAGIYIAFGGIFSTVIATGTDPILPYGLMKLLQGLAFSLGLILVIVGGSELFTGNMLMIIAQLEHMITIPSLLRNWGIVYVGNFLGSLITAILVILSKTYLFSNGEMGLAMVKIAVTKSNYGFTQALVLGILCNVLVCLAVWLSYSAKNTTDRVLAIIFPISAFIAAGFEHSVANMYLVPESLFLKAINPGFVGQLNLNLSNLNWSTFLFNNLLPVSLGNMIGGILFVGVTYYLIYKKKT